MTSTGSDEVVVVAVAIVASVADGVSSPAVVDVPDMVSASPSVFAVASVLVVPGPFPQLISL